MFIIKILKKNIEIKTSNLKTILFLFVNKL